MPLQRSLILLLLTLASPLVAQPRSIGVYGEWGAFRDAARCYAIAEPFEAPRAENWAPFAAIGHFPARRTSAQLHVRLSREKRQGSAVFIRVDGRRFQIVGGGRDAWAPDRAADEEILAAIRTGTQMVVETRSTRGQLVRDRYRLRGAATAMDAAAIACSRR